MTKNAILGILTGYLQLFVQIALQIILAPLLLQKLGQEAMGSYSIISQIMGYITLSDLGMNAASYRFLSQNYNNPNARSKYYDILNIFRYVNVLTGIFVMLCCLFLSIYIDHIYEFSQNVHLDIKNSFLLLAIWAALKSTSSIYFSSLVASQRLAFVNLHSLITLVIRSTLSITSIYLGFGIEGLVISNIISELYIIIICKIKHNNLYPEYAPKMRIENKPLFREMLSFGISTFFINVAVKLIFQSDSLIVGYLYGAVAVSIYYSSQMPSTVLYNLAFRITDNFSPGLNELYGKNELSSIQSLYYNLHKYTLLLILPIVYLLFLYNRDIVTFWVGAKQYAGFEMDISICLFTLIITISHISNAFVLAKGNIKRLGYITLFEGLFNIALSFWLGKTLGLYGVMLATFIANIPTSAYLIYTGRKIVQSSFKNYFTKVLKPIYIPQILLLGYMLFVHYKYVPSNLFDFIKISVSFGALYLVLIYTITLTKNERKIINSQWVKIINRPHLIKNR